MNTKQQRIDARKFTANQALIRGIDPSTLNSYDALALLESIAKEEPRLLQTRWYLNATDNQKKLFKDEWMDPVIRARDIYPYRRITNE